MGSRYLTDLADVLRAAGLEVVELDGWQSRARSSGGYDGGPWCVMWHHTASNGDGASDADYCTYRDPDAPVTNLTIGRDGVVYVCAAGATNTNGKGGPLTLPDGRTVPADGMNTRALSIELSNNGVGMPYPNVQLAAAFTASLAVCAAYGLAADMVATHVAWAPTRKIDPATADAAAAGGWRPASINSSGSWSLDDLRAELVAWSTGTDPDPDPDPEDDDMPRALLLQGTPSGSLQVADAELTSRRPITAASYGALLNTGLYAPAQLEDADVERIPYTPEIAVS